MRAVRLANPKSITISATGGWGSLEYGTPVKGQVIGGRWKILHHALEQSAFADVVGSCGKEMTSTGAGEYGRGGIAGAVANGSALCYVRNDLPRPFVGSVTVEAIHFATGKTTRLSTALVSLPAGGGAVGFLCASNSTALTDGKPAAHCPTFDEIYSQAGCANGAADCMLNVTVASQAGAPVSRSMLPLGIPSSFRLPPAAVSHSIKPAAAGSMSVDVSLTSNATAIYVWLSTTEQGRFSDNAFVLLPGIERKIKFLSFVDSGTSSSALKASFRVEHLEMYMPSQTIKTDDSFELPETPSYGYPLFVQSPCKLFIRRYVCGVPFADPGRAIRHIVVVAWAGPDSDRSLARQK